MNFTDQEAVCPAFVPTSAGHRMAGDAIPRVRKLQYASASDAEVPRHNLWRDEVFVFHVAESRFSVKRLSLGVMTPKSTSSHLSCVVTKGT